MLEKDFFKYTNVMKEQDKMINEFDIRDYKQLELFQPDPLKEQVQGDHYKQFIIQPAEYIFKNSLGFLEGNAIKYITRYPLKNGIVDIDKAIHCLQMLKSLLQQKETK